MLKAFLPKKRRSQPRNGRRRRNAKKNSFARARKPFVVQLFLGFLCAFFFYSFLYFQKEAGTWKNFLLTLGFGYLRNLLLELMKMAFILGHILGKNRLDVIFFWIWGLFWRDVKKSSINFQTWKVGGTEVVVYWSCYLHTPPEVSVISKKISYTKKWFKKWYLFTWWRMTKAFHWKWFFSLIPTFNPGV